MGKKFSISVTGEGMMVGPFFTAAFNRWPKSDLYDHTGKTTAFRQREADLGKSGYLDKSSSKHAKKIQKNLDKPTKTDVVVDFQMRGQSVQDVEIRTKKKKQLSKQSYQLPDNLDANILKIMVAIEHMI